MSRLQGQSRNPHCQITSASLTTLTQHPQLRCQEESFLSTLSNNSESRRVQPLGPKKKTSAFTVIIARFWAVKILVHKISRLPVLCHCCCFAPCSCSCGCCLDPFIVRNVKLVRHSRFHSARTFVLIRDREHHLFLHRFHQIQNSGRHPSSRSGV